MILKGNKWKKKLHVIDIRDFFFKKHFIGYEISP